MNAQEDQEFEQFLRDKAAEAKRDVGYPAKKFLQMLGADGGYKTATTLLSKKYPSDGFTDLLELARLDLTVEALVVESRWRLFFDPILIKKAEDLLRKSGYPFTPFPETTNMHVSAIYNDRSKHLSSDEDQSKSTASENHSNLSAFDDLDAPPAGTVPSRTMRMVSGYNRNPAVRKAVLARAGGKCEHCMTPGFELPDGTLYLEAHHVIGLAQDGPDTMENVIALCANHHKEAHYGRDAEALEAIFLDILAKFQTA